jgi:hypothetical protein
MHTLTDEDDTKIANLRVYIGFLLLRWFHFNFV